MIRKHNWKRRGDQLLAATYCGLFSKFLSAGGSLHNWMTESPYHMCRLLVFIPADVGLLYFYYVAHSRQFSSEWHDKETYWKIVNCNFVTLLSLFPASEAKLVDQCQHSAQLGYLFYNKLAHAESGQHTHVLKEILCSPVAHLWHKSLLLDCYFLVISL